MSQEFRALNFPIINKGIYRMQINRPVPVKEKCFFSSFSKTRYSVSCFHIIVLREIFNEI